MQRYCKQCGVSLAEGAKFCRRCGRATGGLESPATGESLAPTTPIQPTELMSDALPGSLPPTVPIQPTEPVSKRANEATSAALPPPDTRALNARRSLALAGVAVLVVIVAGVSFYLGSLRSPKEPPSVNQTPAASQQPSATADHPDLSAPVKSNQSPPLNKQPRSDEIRTPSPLAVKPANARRGVEQHLDEGNKLLNAGRYHEALREYEQVRRLDPENKDVYYLEGQAYEKLGQLDLALQAYKQCTSGTYVGQATQHVKRLEKKLRR